MEWYERKESLGGWYTDAAELFSGTQEMTIFYDDIEVKVSYFLVKRATDNIFFLVKIKGK